MQYLLDTQQLIPINRWNNSTTVIAVHIAVAIRTLLERMNYGSHTLQQLVVFIEEGGYLSTVAIVAVECTHEGDDLLHSTGCPKLLLYTIYPINDTESEDKI